MTDLTLEAMKTVAEAMAKTAASEVAGQLRDEMHRSFQDIESRISEKLDAEMQRRLGDMDASKHIVQHDRIERLLNWVESMQGTIWKSVVAWIVKWALIASAAWYLVHNGGLPK